jgi:Ca2+-binding RTX toxin-like protein
VSGPDGAPGVFGTRPGRLGFIAENFVATEGDAVTVTVERAAGADGSVLVHYRTDDGTAMSEDYQAASGTLTFADGETSKTFTVQTVDDDVVELDEALVVVLSGPTGRAVVGDVAALVTITDDDAPVCTIGNPDATGNQTLRGTSGADVICGGAGADRIRAGGGDDTIIAGGGNDTVNGDAGDDVIDGGAGNDRLSGGSGDDQVEGGAGNDVVAGNGDADTLSGGDGADSVNGGSGNDTLFGGDGDDKLYGSTGVDHLSGDAGVDYLNGGFSADECTDDGVDRLVGCEAPATTS